MSVETRAAPAGRAVRPKWTAGSVPADTALVAAVLIAGSVSRHAVYTGYGIAILIAAVAGLAAAVAAAVASGITAAPSRAGVLVALAGAVFAQAIKPPYMNVEGGTWLLRAGVWVCLATTVLAAALLADRVRRHPAPVAAVGMAGIVAAYLLVVRGSTRPLIDVWAILQGAALGVVHGQNPYDMVFSAVPRGQVYDVFNYLPATFLVPVPAREVLGDVRYAGAAVLAAGVAALLWWTLRPTVTAASAPALALLLGVLPGSLYDVQQAWNETILAGALVAAAVLLDARRTGWAVVCLAVALATKQHIVLLLPLWACWRAFGWRRAAAAAAGAVAITLPWASADFGRFKFGVLDFFVHLPVRRDSLSIWHLLPGPLQTVTLLTLTVAAYALALTWLPRTPAGLLVGCGLVLAAFDLANKQSFLNQWLLVAQLVVAGLALAARGSEPVSEPDSEPGSEPGSELLDRRVPQE